MKTITGYTGIYQQALPYESMATVGPSKTIYAIGDEKKSQLFLIVLAPSAHDDLVHIAKNSAYKSIVITSPACDSMFLSDLANALDDIRQIKSDVKIMYPKKHGLCTTTNIIGECFTKGMSYINPTNAYISVKLLQNPSLECSVFDFKVTNETKSIYISNYLSKEIADIFFDDEFIDEIHIPYSHGLYGGLSYCDLIAIDKKYAKKFKPNSFACISDRTKYLESSSAGSVKVILSDLL